MKLTKKIFTVISLLALCTVLMMSCTEGENPRESVSDTSTGVPTDETVSATGSVTAADTLPEVIDTNADTALASDTDVATDPETTELGEESSSLPPATELPRYETDANGNTIVILPDDSFVD